MKIKIVTATEISYKILLKLGFSSDDAELVTRNIIDGELSGRKSHGLVRLQAIKQNVGIKKLNTSSEGVEIEKESPVHLHINAKRKSAYIAIYKSLDLAIAKAKKNGICIVGIRNAEYCSGFIGSYARYAAENGLIFMGFNNSPHRLIPYGAKRSVWGTNPITVSFPSQKMPVIVDMASSQITMGDVMVAKVEKKPLKESVAIDKDGNPTIIPEDVVAGGLLPILCNKSWGLSFHKGSALAFMVELMAGALTGSKVGRSVEGGSRGTTYILINPELFRPLEEFKRVIDNAVAELKNSPKAEGFDEIYFAGEKSQTLRKKHLEAGEFEISDNLYNELQNLLKEF
ncbi:MAG: Ldh family oxidoreductase [Patescibacteria group bacterium]